MVSKCHLLLIECFSTIRHIFKANYLINSSSEAFHKTLRRSLTMETELSGPAITYSKSRAIILIKISFSLRHSNMVPLWVFTIFRSYFVIRLRLNKERYFEFASLTDMNLESTLATIYLSWFEGSRSMKHWKHSKRTALAPFLRLLDTLEQTESWQVIKVSANCLSKVGIFFLKVLKNLKIATCRKGSWTPPI